MTITTKTLDQYNDEQALHLIEQIQEQPDTTDATYSVLNRVWLRIWDNLLVKTTLFGDHPDW
jgi:hypothetical protein